MHYSRHRLTALVAYVTHSRTRQPMTNGLALLAHWSVHQKLNRVSSVRFSSVTSVLLRRSVRVLITGNKITLQKIICLYKFCRPKLHDVVSLWGRP